MKRSVDQVQGSHVITKRSRAEVYPPVLKEVRPSDVPKFLHGSEFFKSLNTEDDEVFYIPANYMKENLTVDTLQDACDLLHTVRYWGSDVSLLSVVKFATRKPFSKIRSKLRAFENEVPLIHSLMFILDSNHSSQCRMEKAMELGIVELVAYLHQKNARFSEKAIATAAELGHLDCLHYALEYQNSWEKVANPEKLYEGAVAKGQSASITLLHGQSQHPLSSSEVPGQSDWRHRLPCVAAAHNQLYCLQYLHEKGCDFSQCTMAAAKSGSLACLQYLHQKGNELTSDVCIQAAKVGSLRCLHYFYENGGVWHFMACHAAALNGQLECLRYLLERGCPLMPTGNLSYLVTKSYQATLGEVLPGDLVYEVAKRQHWECVQYLIVYNHPLTAQLATYLAYNNRNDLLRLALHNGCKVEVEIAVYYAETGNLPHLKLVMEHGCKRSAEILAAAAAQGQLQCMIYAHEQGCLWSAKVRGGHLECLRYAREHGCPWDNRVLLAARDYRHQNIVKYAMDNNGPEISLKG